MADGRNRKYIIKQYTRQQNITLHKIAFQLNADQTRTCLFRYGTFDWPIDILRLVITTLSLRMSQAKTNKQIGLYRCECRPKCAVTENFGNRYHVYVVFDRPVYCDSQWQRLHWARGAWTPPPNILAMGLMQYISPSIIDKRDNVNTTN